MWLLDLFGLLVLAAVLVTTTIELWEIAESVFCASLPLMAIAAVLVLILPGRRFFHFALLAIAIQLFCCLLGQACTDPGWVMKRVHCRSNMKRILTALQDYHHEHGTFPPACIVDDNGKPMHSWRVLILPYMNRRDLYNQYDFNEPWDSPDNRELLSADRNPYHCPEQNAEGGSQTNYVAVVGPRTAWMGDEPSRFTDFVDGTSKTLMLVEVVDSGIAWTEPRDLTYQQAVKGIRPGGGLAIGSAHTFSNSLFAPELGAHLGYADGHTELLIRDVSSDQWREVLLLDDGKPTVGSSYRDFRLSDAQN